MHVTSAIAGTNCLVILQLPSAISHLGFEKTLLLHLLFFMDFSGLVQLESVCVFLEGSSHLC